MIGGFSAFLALRSVLGLVKLFVLIGGAATLIGMLSCGVSRIAAAGRTEAELEMLRVVVAQNQRVATAERRAREAARAAQQRVTEEIRPQKERAREAAAAVRQSRDAPRAEGDCPVGCRLPERLRTALEEM